MPLCQIHGFDRKTATESMQNNTKTQNKSIRGCLQGKGYRALADQVRRNSVSVARHRSQSHGGLIARGRIIVIAVCM